MKTDRAGPTPSLPWRIISRDYVLYLMLIPAIGFTFLFSYLPISMNVIAFMDYNLNAGLARPGQHMGGVQVVPAIPERPHVLRRWRCAPSPTPLAKLARHLPGADHPRAAPERAAQPGLQAHGPDHLLPALLRLVGHGGRPHLHVPQHQQHRHHQQHHRAASAGSGSSSCPSPSTSCPSCCSARVWKGVGLGSIIYLATIASIEQQLYEAARIDGAGRWKQLAAHHHPRDHARGRSSSSSSTRGASSARSSTRSSTCRTT